MNNVVPALKNLLILGLIAISISSCHAEEKMSSTKADSNWRSLTAEETRVIENKGTERAFTGKFDQHFEQGAYTCRRCGNYLYRSDDKFKSHCGWPSFDDEIDGAVVRKPDADGRRVEIVCAECDAHLGHIFTGEKLTEKNERHCVNSISLDFSPVEHAIVGGGCFWGVEYYLEKIDGVLDVRSGYAGGKLQNPTYEQICSKKTGHAEVVDVLFDPKKVSYEAILRAFFEIHDPTEVMRQGPDVGPQYRSIILFDSEEEKETAERLITLLKKRGFDIQTELKAFTKFWPAEGYHQDYYKRKNKLPYCHAPEKRFDP